MGRSRHPEAQIIYALKRVEAEQKAEEVARECGVSKHTLYAWEAIKQLRDENARLKRLALDQKSQKS